MRRYRVFLLNALRRVEEEHPFEALTDDEAKRIANDLRCGGPAELWSTHRRIARWD